MAIVAAVNHFLPLLYGKKFTVVTDHKPLTALMSSKTLNKRLQGWALKLSEHNFDIVYRAGDLNGNADVLSRQAWSVEMQPDNTSQFAETSKDLRVGECGAQRRPQKIIALHPQIT